MPEVNANGNPNATLTPGRVTAVLQGSRVTGAVAWRRVDAFALGNFQLTESSELRIFEDGEPVELG